MKRFFVTLLVLMGGIAAGCSQVSNTGGEAAPTEEAAPAESGAEEGGEEAAAATDEGSGSN